MLDPAAVDRAGALAQVAREQAQLGSRDRVAVGVDQPPADADLLVVADGLAASLRVGEAQQHAGRLLGAGAVGAAAVGRRHDVDGERAAVDDVAAGVDEAHEQVAAADLQRVRADRLAAEVRARLGEPVGAGGVGGVGALLARLVGEADVVVLGADHARRGRVGDVDDLDPLDAGVVGGGHGHRVRAVARAAGEQAGRLDGDAGGRRRVRDRDLGAVEDVVDAPAGADLARRGVAPVAADAQQQRARVVAVGGERGEIRARRVGAGEVRLVRRIAVPAALRVEAGARGVLVVAGAREHDGAELVEREERPRARDDGVLVVELAGQREVRDRGAGRAREREPADRARGGARAGVDADPDQLARARAARVDDDARGSPARPTSGCRRRSPRSCRSGRRRCPPGRGRPVRARRRSGANAANSLLQRTLTLAMRE